MLAEIFLPAADSTSGSAPSTLLSSGTLDEDGTIGDWLAFSGDYVHQGQLLGHAEYNGSIVEITAPATGVLHVLVPVDRTTPALSLLGVIDTAPDARAFTVTFTPAEPPPAPAPPDPTRLKWQVDLGTPAPWKADLATAPGPASGVSVNAVRSAVAPVKAPSAQPVVPPPPVVPPLPAAPPLPVTPPPAVAPQAPAARLPLLSRQAVKRAATPESGAPSSGRAAPGPESVAPARPPTTVEPPKTVQASAAAEAPSAEAPAPVPAPKQPKPAVAGQPALKTPAPAPRPVGAPLAATAAVIPPPRARLYASPSARALARQSGVDVIAIQGSGPFGRVEPEDVRAQLVTNAAPSDPASPVVIDATATTVTAASEPPVVEAVTEVMEPLAAEAVTEATEPPAAELVTEATEPQAAEAVTEATEPPAAELVTEATEPLAAEVVTAPAEPPVSEAVAAATESPSAEAITVAAESPAAEAVTVAAEPPEPEAMTEATEPPVAEAATAATEPPEPEAVTKATEPPVEEEVAAAAEPLVAEGAAEATQPAAAEAVTAALEQKPEPEAVELQSAPTPVVTAPAVTASLARTLAEVASGPLTSAPLPAVKPLDERLVATLTVQVDATNLSLLRDRLTDGIQKRTGEPLSYGVILAKLVALALHDHLTLNARQTDQGFEIVPGIGVGLATDTQLGQTIPVLANPGGKDLLTLSREAALQIHRALPISTVPATPPPPSFTIVNLSGSSVDICTPALAQPQCATLGMGRITLRPVVRQDEIVARTTVYLSLTYHATAVRADQAADFLTDLAALVGDPARLAEGLIY